MSKGLYPSLVTVDQAAKLLSVSRSTIWNMCTSGRLVPVKFGQRCTRIKLADIQAMAETGVESVRA